MKLQNYKILERTYQTVKFNIHLLMQSFFSKGINRIQDFQAEVVYLKDLGLPMSSQQQETKINEKSEIPLEIEVLPGSMRKIYIVNQLYEMIRNIDLNLDLIKKFGLPIQNINEIYSYLIKSYNPEFDLQKYQSKIDAQLKTNLDKKISKNFIPNSNKTLKAFTSVLTITNTIDLSHVEGNQRGRIHVSKTLNKILETHYGYNRMEIKKEDTKYDSGIFTTSRFFNFYRQEIRRCLVYQEQKGEWPAYLKREGINPQTFPKIESNVENKELFSYQDYTHRTSDLRAQFLAHLFMRGLYLKKGLFYCPLIKNWVNFILKGII